MRHWRAIVLLLMTIPWIAGCAASLDPDTERVESSPPSTTPPAAGILRLTSFGGWAGTASSENFQLNRMEITPYNASASGTAFNLLPVATFTPLLLEEGGQ